MARRKLFLSIGLGVAIALLSLQKTALSQPATLSEKILGMERDLEADYETHFGRDLAEVTQPPAEIAKTLARLGAETQTTPAVLWVIPRETHLHLVLITPNGEPIVRDLYDVPQERLTAIAEAYTQSITNVYKTPNLEASQQLHDWIIKPFEAEFLRPGNIDTILFCLGGGLRSIPLAALHDGEQYLVEKYASTRIPGFNLIDTDYQSMQQKSILAMGASEFVDQDALPAVPLELATIVQRLRSAKSADGSWSDLSLLNEGFTRSNLRRILAKRPFNIVHLATHADFQPGNPEASYIQFHDGKLDLQEIADLEWQKMNPSIELLVLSACRTALGDEDAELGFAGLALQSGVKSAIATLWYTSDVGSLAFMGDLYQELSLNTTKAEAVRQTQLKMLRGTITFDHDRLQLAPDTLIPLSDELQQESASIDSLSHPYYWAGFSLISSPW